MLIGGADVSGGMREGQRNHVALVVGKEDAINRIYNKIRVNPIHMSEISNQKRLQVYHNLDLSSNDVCGWCFHVNRQQIEYFFLNHDRLKKIRTSKLSIHKNFDSHWLDLFKKDLETFLTLFKRDLSEITVQTDADMRDTINHWRMKNTYKGKARELADAISWFNQKNTKIQNCKVMDLRYEIKERMKESLLE